jgi:hypothetical protein
MLNIHANRPVQVLTLHLYPIIVVEPWSGNCRDVLGQMGGAMPQSINVTPEERDAIERVLAISCS